MKYFSAPMLLVAALLGACAAALFARSARQAPDAFAFEVGIRSEVDGFLQIYGDTGGGFSEAASVRAALLKSDRPIVYQLPLPPGAYRQLRFDPLDRDGATSIVTCRILSRQGEVLRSVALNELRPVQQFSTAGERGGRFEMVVPPGQNDPQLNLAFDPPLKLEVAPGAYGVGMGACGLAVFLVLAALCHAFDRWSPAIVGAAIRRFAINPPIAITLVLCAGILAARRPDAVQNPQLFGEEGFIFYQEAYVHGAWPALFRSYAGYHHAIPRMVAACSLGLDPARVPAFFVAAAFVLTLYVASRALSTRVPLPRHIGCALAVVLVPDAFEVLCNIVNIQWVLAGGLVLLLISADARNGWQLLHDCLAAVLIGLTGPFSIICAPFFLLRAWRRRTTASYLVGALALAAGSVQLWTVLHNPVPAQGTVFDFGALLAVPGMRIGASLLGGVLTPADLPRAVQAGLSLCTLAGVGALAVRKQVARPEFLWMAVIFLGLLAVSLYRCRLVLPDLCHVIFGARYFFPLQLIVIWMLLAATMDQRKWVVRAAGGLLVWALVVNVPRLKEIAFPDLHWGEFAPKIRRGQAVDVPIVPRPWVMSLPEKK
jgi:hypothetical protein